MNVPILDVAAEFSNQFQEMSCSSPRVRETDLLWTQAGGRLQADTNKTKSGRLFLHQWPPKIIFFYPKNPTLQPAGMLGTVTATAYTEVCAGSHDVGRPRHRCAAGARSWVQSMHQPLIISHFSTL